MLCWVPQGGRAFPVPVPKSVRLRIPSRSQPSVQASCGDHPGPAAEHSRPALRAGPGRWEAAAQGHVSLFYAVGWKGDLLLSKCPRALVCGQDHRFSERLGHELHPGRAILT